MINQTKKITINGAGLIGPYLGILLRKKEVSMLRLLKRDLILEKALQKQEGLSISF